MSALAKQARAITISSIQEIYLHNWDAPEQVSVY